MQARRFVVLVVMLVCVGGVVLAQDDDLPLSNWTAAPYWNPGVQLVDAEAGGRVIARAGGLHAQAPAPAPSPLPFVAVTPCRIVDTRVAVSDGFHEPNFSDDEARTFDFPSSPDCPGLPATAGAYSINVQFRPMTQPAYLTAYPTGTTRPAVSTLTAGPAAWVGNAAIVPSGTGGAIDIYCQYAGRVIIDINGYYGPGSVVTSLNTLTGDVTLAEGDNVTLTPTGNTLTISATGGPGGELPIGSSGQTLYYNGSAWTASSALTNNGTDVAISGRLALPTTTATAGQLTLSGIPFLHAYGAPTNTFAGLSAGNFTSTGTGNTGVGASSLSSNTTGFYNTGSGAYSLWNNTEGSENTAIGLGSMASTTTGSQNTAVGASSLLINVEGSGNTAIGRWSLNNNLGSNNIAIGAGAGYNLQTGSGNIDIGNAGGATDEATTIRIGTSQDHTYIAGIRGVTTDQQDAIPVLIDSTGRLGTVPSSVRFKQDVADMGEASSRLMELRPVTFHYKSHPDGLRQYGLIAEEVDQVMPELVVRDATGQVETVAYHLLPAMLLNEVKKQQAQIADQAKTIQAQQAQIEELRNQVRMVLDERRAARPRD